MNEQEPIIEPADNDVLYEGRSILRGMGNEDADSVVFAKVLCPYCTEELLTLALGTTIVRCSCANCGTYWQINAEGREVQITKVPPDEMEGGRRA